MCMVLYAAADRPVTGPEWDEERPGFHVQSLSERESAVRSRFTKPYVVYLGAHTGCGCGFSYGMGKSTSFPGRTIEQDDADGRESVAALRRFLVDQLEAGGEVELLSCWDGDELLPLEIETTVDPEFFEGETFELEEKALYRVRSLRKTSPK